jgi:tRNA A37 threonylcarbamoyladenosine biosynthesis protein TsaE
MEDLGMVLAAALLATDLCPTVLLLDGDLGAGKTALSRGFLKAATGDPTLLVTSPTYLLSNVYTLPPTDAETDASPSSSSAHRRRVHHMDLYRLAQTTADDPVVAVRDLLRPLNLDDTFTQDVVLVEWPERLGEAYSQRHEIAGRRWATQATNNEAEMATLPMWPVLPSDWLDIDIRIRTKASSVTLSTDCEDPDEAVNVQDRVVRLLPVGDKWTQALQGLVQEGYVDDFLYPDDDED